MEIMNNISISGRVVKDIELSKTVNGITLTRFNVAVPSELKDENGDRKADFFICIAWRENAESIAKYFKKGSPIELYGSINSRSYTTKAGTTSTIWELNVKGWGFGNQSKDENQETKSNKSKKGSQAELMPIDEDMDEDLPF